MMLRGSSFQFLIQLKRRHQIKMFYACYNKVEVGIHTLLANHIKLYFICVTYGLPYFSFRFVSLRFFLFFSFSFVSFLFSLFCFRFFAFRFFSFLFVTFLLVFFSFFFFPFLFVSFRFFPFLSLQVPAYLLLDKHTHVFSSQLAPSIRFYIL